MAPAFTPEKMRLAARLKDARKRANISQERASKQVGTSRRHWIRWESGETMPNEQYLARIAAVLGDPSLAAVEEEDEEVSSHPLSRDEFSMLGDLMRRLGSNFTEATR